MKRKFWFSFLIACIFVYILGTECAYAATQQVTYGDLTYTVLYDNTLAVTGCDSSVTSITVPSSCYGRAVTAIQDGAFSKCENLTDITLPDGIVLIGYYAFNGCSSLTNITIPNSVTRIGERAFYHCTSLENIIIPNSVLSIGKEAFYGCSSLTSVAIGKMVTTIEEGAFGYCSSLTSIVVPNSVTSIGDGAFDWCTSLNSLTIGTGVTSIGNSAFSGCFYLEKIDWKAKCVGDFNGSYKEKKLAFNYAGQKGEGIEVVFADSVERIPAYLFYTYSNTSVNLSIPKISSVRIGTNVVSIGERAFYNCRPKNITVSKSVQSIEGYAFYGYTSSSDINAYYDGTDDEWNAISIANGNDAFKNARRKPICYITMVPPDGNSTSSTCQPGEKINVSEIEKKYMRRVTLYTDTAMTQEFNAAEPVSNSLTLYIKLGEEITGVTVSGTAVSWNNSDDALYYLYPTTMSDADIRAQWKTSGTVIGYSHIGTKGGMTQNADGKRYDQAFNFSEIPEGTYKLVIFKPGKYVPKIVEITVSTSDYSCGEQKLWLYGDVNYNGIADDSDATQIIRYAALKTSVFNNGDEATKADRLLAADVNSSGVVDDSDATQIARYAVLKASVFNTIP